MAAALTTYATPPEDWREQLRSLPDFQEACKRIEPQVQELKDRENLFLPPHHIWLTSLPAFDLASALFRFLQELGFGQQAAPETASIRDASHQVLCEATDFTLLSSILSNEQCQQLGLAAANKNVAPPKASDVLDVLSRVALKPFATLPILLHFRPVFIDLAARWIQLCGFNGFAFDDDQAKSEEARASLYSVFNAFAQVLEYNWALFPLLQILLRHPLMVQDPFNLLSPSFKAQDLSRLPQQAPPLFEGSQAGIDDKFGHPDLLPLLWSLHRLLTAVPALPFQHGLQGWKYPPQMLEGCMKRHPSLPLRLLAWRVYRKWASLFASDGDRLLHKWVCQPDEYGHCPPFPKDGEDFQAREALAHRHVLLGQAAVPRGSAAPSVLVRTSSINAWVIPEEESNFAFETIKKIQSTIEETPSAPQVTEVHEDSNAMELDNAPAAFHSFCASAQDLSSLVSLIANQVVLPKEQPVRALIGDLTPQHEPPFVMTRPATAALRELASKFSSRAPILLMSPPASGKTSMIAHLAAQLGSSSIVSISLADRSIDAKSLLGSLSSSSTEPGTFTFIEGTLTRCLKQGKWLVLDDIDMAAPDVLALIASLAERMRERSQTWPAGAHGGVSGEASVGVSANGRWVPAREGFALFATTNNILSPPRWLGCQFWAQVAQQPLVDSDMADVLAESFPRIHGPLMQEILRVWEVVCDSKDQHRRQITFRDLHKWTRRINNLVPASAAAASTFRRNPTFQEEAFLEAFDVFFSSVPDITVPSVQHQLSRLSAELGLSEERAAWLLDGRSPECILPSQADATRNSRLKIGRITLQRKLQALPKHARPYAMTKASTNLLEKLAVSTHFVEPVLFVGETGTGKTTTVSQLAMLLGQELIALNMSNQSEASDLIGGFKPIDLSAEAYKLAYSNVNLFSDLFDRTFGSARNADFLTAVRTALNKRRWPRLAALFKEACKMAGKKLRQSSTKGASEAQPTKKRRKLEGDDLTGEWEAFKAQASDFEARFASGASQETKLAFAFVEGPLVRALREGHWILLDEINLASAETLESVGALLSSAEASLVVTERGDLEPVARHPAFRIFACMNPATDVGKRDLPSSLRAKLTEIYVAPPDSDKQSLLSIIEQYIGSCSVGDRGVLADVADLYMKVKGLAVSSHLADGANSPPHYSVRTLARALTFAADNVATFGLRRALYEGFVMTFTMLLDQSSTQTVCALLRQHLFRNDDRARAVLSKKPDAVSKRDKQAYSAFHHFQLKRGPVEDGEEVAERYVLTPSVTDKLTNLARVVSAHRYPVLIQGPTSSGKTSIIEYLAAKTGHRFVRINNHEHTDIQEYLGTYASDPVTGKLVFREGLLVQALRRGDWIVLDELNLAPTDVLEALNRLLDDNRELIIPETQEVVTPHPHFMLFATQNPPNSFYGGRKALSRAFRNRFLEMHFDDVPRHELETILETRCRIAPSYAKKMVAVFDELQHRRQAERVFEEKQSFATLRDLFRWGGREAVGYEQLASNGYMLIAERARTVEDRLAVKEVLERVLKVRIDPDSTYAEVEVPEGSMVWTPSTRRLFTLVSEAIKFGEPVLLVGETGTGKTTVCQCLAASLGLLLRIVNCHLNTDAADILGGYRPSRDTDSQAMFEWHDGPLVEAMKTGGFFLLDEISLADDSVLERLNSVLEPAKTLVLAEKGGSSIDDLLVKGRADFHVLATMNPGGDFGKKELSPALRNRFTEIWVPAIDDDEDLREIIASASTSSHRHQLAAQILDFSRWFASRFLSTKHATLRSLLAWVDFINHVELDHSDAFTHGALFTLVDGLGSLPASAGSTEEDLRSSRLGCLHQLSLLVGPASSVNDAAPNAVDTPTKLSIGPFAIDKRENAVARHAASFNLAAPTPRENCLRLFRALQITKPVLLEGSPGVGKTSLVAAMASFTGQPFIRINLSDQTDLSDLFGSDMPVEGGAPGQFAWRDAPFLTALQSGHWVLLDEMNLAPQPVLEGLNSCLDHRGEVYIPELGRSFTRHPDFRIFAAQNPIHQGGSRKGLPRSFVDRFTQVFVAPLQRDDFVTICSSTFPKIPASDVANIVDFNLTLARLVDDKTSSFGSVGSPWDFNLRDIMRWLSLMSHPSGMERHLSNPVEYLDIAAVHRFRTTADRSQVYLLASQIFGAEALQPRHLSPMVSASTLQIGHAASARGDGAYLHVHQDFTSTDLSRYDLAVVQSALKACEQNWLVVITGDEGSGKSSFLRSLSYATGNHLQEFCVSNQTDALELLGGYEQANWRKAFQTSLDRLELLCLSAATDSTSEQSCLARAMINAAQQLLSDAAQPMGHSQHSLYDRFCSLSASVKSSDLLENTLELDSLAVGLENFSGRGAFQWEDGPLVNALTQGHWFVVDNANLCPGSVLDRLNSLVEPNGFLLLNEHASPQNAAPVLKPHPSFRLFFTCNSRYGELSRAMRNRGVEINLGPSIRTPGSKHPSSLVASTENASSPIRSILAMDCAVDVRAVLPTLIMTEWTSTQAQSRLWRVSPWSDFSSRDAYLSLLHSIQSLYSALLHETRARPNTSSILPVDPENTHLLDVSSVKNTGPFQTFGDKLHLTLAIQAGLHSLTASDSAPRPLVKLEQAFQKELFGLATSSQTNINSMQYQHLLFLYQGLLDAIGSSVPDYALLQELLRWMQEALQPLEEQFASSLKAIDETRQQSLLTRGKAVELLWGRFFVPSRQRSWQIHQSLAASAKKTHKISEDLLSLVVELGSALRYSASQSVENATRVDDLAASAIKKLEEAGTQESEHVLSLQDASNGYFLRVISSAPLIHQAHKQLQDITLMPAKTLHHHLPLLEDLSQQAREGVSSKTFSIVINAINALPSAADEASSIALTRNFLQRVSETPLKESLDAQRNLKRTLGASIQGSQAWPHGLTKASRGLAKALVAELAHPEMADRHLPVSTELLNLSEMAEGCCRKAPDTLFAKAWQKQQCPKDVDFMSLNEQERAASDCLTASGMLWDLFATDVPYDPAVALQAWDRDQDARKQQLVSEAAWQQIEDADFALPRSRHLWQKLELTLRCKGQQADRLFVPRPSGGQQMLVSLTQEVNAANDRFFTPDVSRSLFHQLDSIRKGVNATEAQAVASQVESALASLQIVRSRLQDRYNMVDDLVQPLEAAVKLRMQGLQYLRNCLANRTASTRSAHAAAMVCTSVSYPKSEAALSLATHPSWFSLPLPTHKKALFQLQAIAHVKRRFDPDATALSRTQYATVAELYQQIQHQWQNVRDRMQQEDEQASSVYRNRDTRLADLQPEVDDASLEEALFNDEGSLKDQSSITPTKILHRELEAVSAAAFDCHLILFGAQRSITLSIAPRHGEEQMMISELRDHLDHQLSVLDTSAQVHTIDSLWLSSHPEQGELNYYKDPNPEHCRQTLPVLQACLTQVRALCDEWPDQMILQDLRERLEDLADLPMISSPSRVLRAIETILPVIEDWESVANKERSLFTHKMAFVHEAIRYRQLELRSWPALLDAEEAAFARAARRWWAEMLELVLGSASLAPVSSSETVAGRKAYLDQTASLAETFMKSSPRGQFAVRIDLVRSFSKYAREGKDFGVADILEGIVAAYEVHTSFVKQAIEQAHKEASASVKDLIRLASWKDVNIIALQQSAKKSHNGLLKVIRAFRSKLQIPAVDDNKASLLQSQQSNVSWDSADVAAPRIEELPNVPSCIPVLHMDHARGILSKLNQLSTRQDQPSAAGLAEQMSSRLHLYTKDLKHAIAEHQSEAIEGDSPEARSKHAANLISGKKRTVAEAFKELKRLGLSLSPATTVVEAQQTLAALMSSGSLDSKASSCFDQGLSLKVDQSFNRLSEMLPKVRLSPANHHEDISSRDVAKAVGALESGVSMVLSLRRSLGTALSLSRDVHVCFSRLAAAHEQGFKLAHTSVADGNDVSVYHRCSLRLECALVELRETLERHAHLPDLMTSLEQLCVEASTVRRKLASIFQPVLQGAGHTFVLEVDKRDFLNLSELLARVSAQLRTWSVNTSLSYVIDPVADVVQDCMNSSRLPAQSSPPAVDLQQAHDQLLGNCLLIAQDLSRLQKPEPDEAGQELPKSGCITETKRHLARCKALRLDSLAYNLRDLFAAVSNHRPDERNFAQDCLGRVFSFLQPVIRLVGASIAEAAQWQSSLVDLLELVASTTLTIAQKGFCRPVEAEENASGGQGEGAMEMTDGTGMGEGSGSKDVSDQIEGAEQLEGLQGEDEQPQDRQEEGDKEGEGIDMSGDLEVLAENAQTEDVEREEGEDEGSDGEEGDEEPEDAVDDVDPLASTAVDEKFWGDDQKEEGKDSQQEDQMQQQQQSKQEQTSDLAERQQGQEERTAAEQDAQEPQDTQDQDSGEAQEEPDEGPQQQPEASEVNVPEGETMDVPDDLKLEEDKEEDAPGEDDLQQGDDFDMQDATEPAGPDDEGQQDDDATEDPQATEGMQEDANDGDADEGEPEGAFEAQPEEASASAENTEAGAGGAGLSGGKSPLDQNQAEEDWSDQTKEAASQGQGQGGSEGQAASADGNPDPNAAAQKTEEKFGSGSDDKSRALDQQRVQGDALEEWTRRLEILDATEENRTEDRQNGEDPQSGQVESGLQYTHDDQAADQQALGPADPQQAAASNVNLEDEDMTGPETLHGEEADIPAPAASEAQMLDFGVTDGAAPPVGGSLTSSEVQRDASKDYVLSDSRENVMDSKSAGQDVEPSKAEQPPLDESQHQAADSALLQWQTSEKQSMSSAAAWKMYCSLTRAASFHLTEQLRLILEPTQATRLQGDYRTGKRLNMKRLIPYIASEFTKDKIWLRRTRPSDRSYQVLVALDDSKSMADPAMVHLTFQALALVTSALERLEVGQVSVDTFGNQVRVLHDFDDGNVGTTNGHKLLDGTTFSQSKTDYTLLLQSALKRFAEARAYAPPSSNGELWQLMLIISDGSMDNFDSVRASLRQATQNKVFVVFIIVDSANRNQSGMVAGGSAEGQSILERRFARVGTNSSGQLEIQDTRYMDLFPFDYYVVLREANALPDVLCRTLRQFFEMVQGR